MKQKLSAKQVNELLGILQERFEKNTQRHKNITWKLVQERLGKKPEKLGSLWQMEQTGGEPDVIEWDAKTGVCIFYDCSAESPAGRRSFCYDRKALESRKEHQPLHTVLDSAADMDVELLTEAQYRLLQEKGSFDLKTSSWVQTPEDIRNKGGALFCDRRYGHVFLYHNGAQSYYASRGYRASLRV